MQRAQRGRDNAALDLAIDTANMLGLPVLAVFALTADYPGAQIRHYAFLLEGLVEVAAELASRGVPLVTRLGQPPDVVSRLAAECSAALVVGDENPLRIGKQWRESLAGRCPAPFLCVDADVVVPSGLFSHEEYAARTIRPKIRRLLVSQLVPSSEPLARVSWLPERLPRGEPLDPAALLARLGVGGASAVSGYRGGPVEARWRLNRFTRERLSHYETSRNDPTVPATSELSAHLHFGHIGPVEVALAVAASGAEPSAIDAFLEELVARRELAVNFVLHNPHYDRLEGCPGWARQTLERHARDPRPHRYSARALENAETHDPLWNAAQREMVISGRMHNYLRMYWAKKILEWSEDAAEAFAIAVDLNDRYEMDGRDPNGYAGVAWAIGGKHDRPWPERPILGTVRSMTLEGARRKFDTGAYIAYARSLGSSSGASSA